MIKHYVTAFWNNRHPQSDETQTLMKTYLDGPDVDSSAPRGSKVLLRRLQQLGHWHYRFYNDGDAFSYRGVRVGQSSTPSNRTGSGRYYYNVEGDNRMLHELEDEIASITRKLWIITNGASK